MRVRSVNVSLPRMVEMGGRTVRTAIFKEPVAGPVRVHPLHLEGDGQADLRYHGGPTKAVYAYPWEHYAHWQEFLAVDDLPPGYFGENLTTEGLDEREVRIGDSFRIGTTLLQVSEPREPCSKLAAKTGRRDLLKPFLASGRVGFYLRVLEEGELAAGDVIEPVSVDPAGLTIVELLRVTHFERDDRAGARRAVAVEALAEGWRQRLLTRL
ncbi:MAG: MOSC domain-containing protein [Acidobacteriota bacterium]